MRCGGKWKTWRPLRRLRCGVRREDSVWRKTKCRLTEFESLAAVLSSDSAEMLVDEERENNKLGVRPVETTGVVVVRK